MLDTHCHLDRYPDPLAVAQEAEREKIVTVGVTNLPSHFEAGVPHVRQFRYVRLALGLHPLAARSHKSELPTFRQLVEKTSYIGEVGLDFSKEGAPTRAQQEESFREVLSVVSERPKLITLHSRGAEGRVLELLKEYDIRQAVFHWYSGSRSVLAEALSCGHYFSSNPAMVRSRNGRAVIAQIPRDRMLTETDGPYVKIGNRPARPPDVRLVIEYLSECWGVTVQEVLSRVRKNFDTVLGSLSGS
jgi:TatD DNase family protein